MGFGLRKLWHLWQGWEAQWRLGTLEPSLLCDKVGPLWQPLDSSDRVEHSQVLASILFSWGLLSLLLVASSFNLRSWGFPPMSLCWAPGSYLSVFWFKCFWLMFLYFASLLQFLIPMCLPHDPKHICPLPYLWISLSSACTITMLIWIIKHKKLCNILFSNLRRKFPNYDIGSVHSIDQIHKLSIDLRRIGCLLRL